jgi:hypothetical protein
MQGLKKTRPVLVRGYESMVMVRGACWRFWGLGLWQ